CFPSMQIEALLSGTPLVTTDIPGAREVVQVTGMGRLVRPRDPQALADGIVGMLRDPAPYQPTREAVLKVFNPQRSLAEYEALMEQLVRESSSKVRRFEGSKVRSDATTTIASMNTTPGAEQRSNVPTLQRSNVRGHQ